MKRPRHKSVFDDPRYVRVIRYGAVELLVAITLIILGLVSSIDWTLVLVLFVITNICLVVLVVAYRLRGKSQDQSTIPHGGWQSESGGDSQKLSPIPDAAPHAVIKPVDQAISPSMIPTPIRRESAEVKEGMQKTPAAPPQNVGGADEVTRQDAAPPEYDQLLHWKSFFKEAVKPTLVVLVTLAVLVTLLAFSSFFPSQIAPAVPVAIIILIAVILAGMYALYRSYWKWQHRPIKCDPEDGIVEVHQTRNRWLFLRGSAPDPYPVDEVKLITPDQTWMETWFFQQVHTLVIKEGESGEAAVLTEIHDVVDVQKLLDIQRYRQQLKYGQQGESNELLRQIRDELQRRGRI